MRYHVARIKSENRFLWSALDSYFTDHGSYPPEGKSFEHWGASPEILAGAHAQHFRAPPVSLTTPVAYIRVIYDYNRLGERRSGRAQIPPAYLPVSGEPRYFLISPGPDRVFDVQPEHIPLIQDGIPRELAHLLYDPSNGIFTGGDIMSSHQGEGYEIINPPSRRRRPR